MRFVIRRIYAHPFRVYSLNNANRSLLVSEIELAGINSQKLFIDPFKFRRRLNILMNIWNPSVVPIPVPKDKVFDRLG